MDSGNNHTNFGIAIWGNGEEMVVSCECCAVAGLNGMIEKWQKQGQRSCLTQGL